MRLAMHTDYGLRILMYLVSQNRRATIGDIAEFFGISKDHLAKVAQRLVRDGFVRSIRGIGGGLELARDADQITIGEVVERLEGSTEMLECVSSTQNVCLIQPKCKLRQVLATAEQLQMDYLRSVKLSEIVTRGKRLTSIKI